MDSFMSFVSLTSLPEDPGFATYFNHLRKTKECVDVTFILATPDGEMEFCAHQLLLAMRSSFFADEFYKNQGKREHRIVRLKGTNPKAFEAMIRYCYGCQPGLETIKETGALYQVADQFKVTSLVNVCRSHLKNFKIEHRNVFTLLEISEYMKDKRVTDMCMKFIEEKNAEVLKSFELTDITPAVIEVILSLSKLSFSSEYELINWIFDWAKVKSEEKHSSYKSIREYLNSFFQEMNFLDLTFEEFAMLCKDYPDVFDSDEISSIYMNIACPGSCYWKMPDWFHKDLKFREYTGWEKVSMIFNELVQDVCKCIKLNLAKEEHCMEPLTKCRDKETTQDQFLKTLQVDIIFMCYKYLWKISQLELNIEEFKSKINIQEIGNLTLKKIKDIIDIDDIAFARLQMWLKKNEEYKKLKEELERTSENLKENKEGCTRMIKNIRKSSERHNKLQEVLRKLLELKLEGKIYKICRNKSDIMVILPDEIRKIMKEIIEEDY